MMIGQQSIKELINQGLSKLTSRFIIVEGIRGSGKSEIINTICADMLGCEPEQIQTIDGIRQICIDAVDFTHNRAFVLSNFESLNFRTKESILKLCEDIPPYLYIFIEVNSIENIKETLVNRAMIIKLEPYTEQQLRQYCKTLTITDVEEDMLVSTFKSPGDINRALSCGIQNLFAFCDKVLSFVTKASIGNAMKIVKSLKVKTDGEGFDMDLFFTALINRAMSHFEELGAKDTYNIVHNSNTALNDLAGGSTLNKTMIFDTWLLSIKGV